MQSHWTYHVRSVCTAVAAGIVTAGEACGVPRGGNHGIAAQVCGNGRRCARQHKVDIEGEGPVVVDVNAGDLEVQHLAHGDADAAALIQGCAAGQTDGGGRQS